MGKRLKKIKIELTPLEFETITISLFEYSGICEAESESSAGTVDGYETYKNENTAGLRLSKYLNRLVDKLHQMKAKGEQ